MDQTNKATNKLAKNTAIYFVGNFGSKILQFLILPILTAVLLTEEYGYYDLVITTINLLLPIITLQLIEAIFRYLFDSKSIEEHKQIVTTVVVYLIFGSLLLALVMFGISLFSDAIQYPILIYFNFISCIFFTFYQKMARSLQKNASVAVSGVLNTVVMLAVQAVTLLMFKMRVDGLLIANMIAHFIAAIYLQTQVHIFKYLDIKSVNKNKLIDMLKFSLPLVPNSVCWWIVSACDKYIITAFIGLSMNGIYSIASKFSQLLTMITSIFQMAWQESSIMESNNEMRLKFYSKTFNTYIRFLLAGFIVILPAIRILMPYLVSKSYQIGYLYSPILLLGAVFSAFSQFYGSAYLAFKKTNGAFTTTIIAAIVNIAIGIGLINFIGVFAPAIGTAVSFLVQWLIRKYQMREYFKLNIDKLPLLVLSVLSGIYIALYYLNNIYLHVGMIAGGLMIFIFFNKELITNIFKTILVKMRKIN